MDQVKPYDLTRGERVTLDYFTALEVIFRIFCAELEAYFFDQFNLACQFDFKITKNIKFKDYIAQVDQPQSMVHFDLEPLKETCLLVLNNKMANLFLGKEKLEQKGKLAVPDRFLVTEQNHEFLQDEVEDLLSLLAQSWSRITPAESYLLKLVSHRIKARILNPEDGCMVVKVNLTHKTLKSSMEFCFSAYQLDPILKQYGQKALLQGSGTAKQLDRARSHLLGLLENKANYSIKGVVGHLDCSLNQLSQALATGKPLPLKSHLNSHITVEVNGVPTLSAVAGLTHENLALQINGRYEVVEKETKKKPKPFKALSFPKG